MKIDAHQHFWKYDPLSFGWINDTMATIRRDFMPCDLKREISSAGIDGVVAVQARQSIEETRWLLALSEQHAFIRGVLGWAPLVSADVDSNLAEFASHARFSGVRHVLHDEADDEYMLRADFNDGVRLLARYKLAYDILIFERHLPQTVRFVDQHPAQVFILDHVAKPRIRERLLSPWREHMNELARRPNVYCKLSGMVTEADWTGWTDADVRPYIDVVINAFGPQRVMVGSDWPVCLVACAYRRWFQTVDGYISRLSATERDWITGQTAIKAYRL